MSPLYYFIPKKTKIAIFFKAYFFLLLSNVKNIKITTEKILEEEKV